MSVFCTNSGNTYASLPELVTAEATLHVGEVVIELSGLNTGDVTFTAQDFDSVKIIAVAGEEFDPTTSTGAIHTGKITATCPLIIDGTRVYDISVVYPTAQILNSEFGGAGNVGLTYGTSNNVYAYNCVIHDTYRGSYATGANQNATLENCTLYNNSNLGLLRCNCINTVVIDCAGTDYFSAVSQVNTWGDDASAQNIVTDGYSTFVDFASGDVRIRTDSDAGLAGAGAFIEESAAVSVDVTIETSYYRSEVFDDNVVIYKDISIQESTTHSSFSVYNPSITIYDDLNIEDTVVNTYSEVYDPHITIYNDINITEETTNNSFEVYDSTVVIEKDLNVRETITVSSSTVYNPTISIEIQEPTVSVDINVVDSVVTTTFEGFDPHISILEDINILEDVTENTFVTYKDTISIGSVPFMNSYTLSYRKLNTRASYRNINYSIKYRNK